MGLAAHRGGGGPRVLQFGCYGSAGFDGTGDNFSPGPATRVDAPTDQRQ